MEVAALLLAKLKQSAEAYVGVEVPNAVIAVSAQFNMQQRAATYCAAEAAGITVLRLVSEPQAAAIAIAAAFASGGR